MSNPTYALALLAQLSAPRVTAAELAQARADREHAAAVADRKIRAAQRKRARALAELDALELAQLRARLSR